MTVTSAGDQIHDGLSHASYIESSRLWVELEGSHRTCMGRAARRCWAGPCPLCVFGQPDRRRSLYNSDLFLHCSNCAAHIAHTGNNNPSSAPGVLLQSRQFQLVTAVCRHCRSVAAAAAGLICTCSYLEVQPQVLQAASVMARAG